MGSWFSCMFVPKKYGTVFDPHLASNTSDATDEEVI
jgi:hypothetical protein